MPQPSIEMIPFFLLLLCVLTETFLDAALYRSRCDRSAAFLALIEGGVGIWVAHKDTRKNHELDPIGQCFAYPV